jgi:hypothetical protein
MSIFRNYYYDYITKEDGTGRTCNMHNVNELCIQILVGKPKRRYNLG